VNAKRLWVADAPDDPTLDDFVWRRPADGPSSLQSNLDPDLAQLGDVPHANRDAVWLATTVFLADRTTPRRKGWHRDLHVAVPVVDQDTWRCVRDDLEATLSFLTSDSWNVDFLSGSVIESEGSGADAEPGDEPEVVLVCLFSGGADSMCGAIRALAEGFRVALVSHWDWSGHAAIQTRLVRDLEKLFGVEVPHVQVNLGRSSRQLEGARFPDEASRRSRSLLFVTLGLAVASIGTPTPMWLAENGFASLNPPLAPERRASLSTRSTHPTFLGRIQATLRAVGAHADFSNPFARATKGEMFASVVELIGRDQAAALLSKTHSCAHLRWAGRFGRPPDTQCGVCFGCLVRRGAFVASGLEDHTTYLATDLPDHERRAFLTPHVRADIEAVRYATSGEFGPAGALAMDLPVEYDPKDALDLIRRGLAELAAVELP
jgi:7-cyano-7-deazaguanine synthase in queuosine biosynthesis